MISLQLLPRSLQSIKESKRLSTGCERGEQHEDAKRGDQEDEATEEGGALQEEAFALGAQP